MKGFSGLISTTCKGSLTCADIVNTRAFSLFEDFSEDVSTLDTEKKPRSGAHKLLRTEFIRVKATIMHLTNVDGIGDPAQCVVRAQFPASVDDQLWPSF